MKKTIFTTLPATTLCCNWLYAVTSRVRIRFVVLAFATAFLFSPTEKALSQGNNYEGPIGVTGIFNGNITTGSSYDPLTHSAHREITDIVVPGSLGKYPLKLTRYYNSRQQYYAGNAIGLSTGWAHEYSWLLYTAGEKVVSPHGNVYDFHCGAPVGVSEGWDDRNQGAHPTGGVWRLADGGKVHFNGGQVDSIEDPYGLTTAIEYQNGQRWRVTEPGGRCLVFTYNATDPSDNTRLLTKVEAYDYFGGHRIDWVSYTYTNVDSGGHDPITGQPIIKKMLTGVAYSDGTSASYTYTTDNVPENGTSHKMYPLLQRCDDVRYNGPMRTIVYDYQNGGSHGTIIAEKYPNVGAVSSVQQAPGDQDSSIETRGDGPTRKFTYTHFDRCQGPDCVPCDDYQNNTPPQQMLKEYTDFQGHTNRLGYDERFGRWYITSVTDANTHTTTYTRGNPPSLGGIGEILGITYPNNTGSIQYGYQAESNVLGGHYLTSITEQRDNGRLNKTIHTRDPNTHRITRTDYRDENSTLLAYETFDYCDQGGDPQCGNQAFGQLKRHRQKNGGYVHYRYDQRGLLIDKWEPTWTATASDSEPKTHFDYYTTENSYTATDGQLIYPWMDRVKTVTGPPPNWAYTEGPASETYEYERVLGANGITDLNGAARPGRGLVTKSTHADGKFQRFAYDAYSNKRWEDNELRNATSYTYDQYNRLRNVTRPLNEITTYTYNPTNGGGSPLLHTTNNPDTVTLRTSATTNIVTSNDYDENFRKISSTVAGRTTWFHYDNVGNQDYVTDPRGAQSGDSQYTIYTDYDARNRKWRVREPLGRTTQFYYDDKINVTRILRPDQTTETKAYDGMNRLITDTVPKETGVNIVTRLEYYPYNVRSGSLLKTVTDGENHNTTFEYDPSGLKTKMTYHDNSCRTWAYDDAHNLKNRITVNAEIQNFAYDNRNRKTGEWWDGFPADGEWRTFGYDLASHLTSATNGTGQLGTNMIADVTRSYDGAGRLTQDQQKVYANGVPIVRNVNYPSYDDGGKLLRMSVDNVSPAYDYTFSYDTMGRFEKIQYTGSVFVAQYQYDAASNEKQRDNLFNGVSQIYPRDALNRTQYVDLKRGATPLGHEGYEYDTASRLGSVTREDNKQDRFTYYKDGELNVATYGAAPTATPAPTPTPPAPVAQPTFNPDGAYFVACANSYTFNVRVSSTTNGAGIRWTTDGINWTDMANEAIAAFTVGANQTKTLQAYAYVDATNSNVYSADYSFERECAGQDSITPVPPYPLDNAGAPSAGPAAPDLTGTVTYILDNAGNRRSVNGQTYTPNTINQYTVAADSPVTNGNDHEIQVYGGFTFHYMRDQELKQITATGFTYDFAYDALGRCVKRTVNGVATYYVYDGEKPILEYNSNNALLGFNLYGKGVDEIIERGAYGTDNQWHWYFPQQDHEGSVTHLTDANGAIIERYRYDVFGGPAVYAPNWTVRAGSSYNNRFLFTGREYLGGLVYDYRARVYSAYLGRFMSEDPKLFDAGDYNLFRYCHNDPTDFTDPMGLDSNSFNEHFNYFVQSPDLNRNVLRGSFINVISKPTLSQQCAKGAQFMAGTFLKDGLHGVPTTHTATGKPQWFQGPAVGPNTNGMLVARGFINGVYPSLSPEQTQAGQIINHAGIQTAYSKGIVQVFDQWQGQPLGDRRYNANQEGWSVVLIPKAAGSYAKQSNDLVPTAQPNPGNANAIEDDGVQKSLRHACEVIGNMLRGMNPKEP